MKMILGILDTVRELFQFLWHKKLWWLIPAIAVMLLLAALILFGHTTPIAPFIYTLF